MIFIVSVRLAALKFYLGLSVPLEVMALFSRPLSGIMESHPLLADISALNASYWTDLVFHVSLTND
jgi:hypothetical protein